MTADRETWSMPNGEVLVNVHPIAQCEGRPCVIHDPTPHKMREWPVNMRASGLMERLCEHGIGHPDPDSVWYLENVRGWYGYDVHGCDGCCVEGVAS